MDTLGKKESPKSVSGGIGRKASGLSINSGAKKVINMNSLRLNPLPMKKASSVQSHSSRASMIQSDESKSQLSIRSKVPSLSRHSRSEHRSRGKPLELDFKDPLAKEGDKSSMNSKFECDSHTTNESHLPNPPHREKKNLKQYIYFTELRDSECFGVTSIFKEKDTRNTIVTTLKPTHCLVID